MAPEMRHGTYQAQVDQPLHTRLSLPFRDESAEKDRDPFLSEESLQKKKMSEETENKLQYRNKCNKNKYNKNKKIFRNGRQSL